MLEKIDISENFRNNLLDIKDHHFAKYITFKDLSSMADLDVDVLMGKSDWYLINGKLYYFKANHIFTELFTNEMIPEYDLRNLNYDMVKRSKQLGIISESFRVKPSKFFNYEDFFIDKGYRAPNTLRSLERTFSKMLHENNKKRIVDDFYKLTSFDIFTGQADRGSSNVVIEENTETLLAPIFDNEYAFYDNSKYCSAFDIICIPEIGSLRINNPHLFNLLSKNKTFLKYFTKSLDIDVSRLLKNTTQKYNFLISNEEIEFIINFFDNRKKRIEHTLTLMNKHK